MPLKQQELNAAMENDWAIGLTEAPCKEPKEFFIGLCCCPGWPCVAVYTQRKELLQVTGEPYVCCGGMFPCGPCKDPQDESCLFCESSKYLPEMPPQKCRFAPLQFCEAGCCPYCGIVGNRYLVQTRFSDMIAKAKIVAQPGMPQPQMMGQPMPQQPSMYGYQGQGQQQMAAASRPGALQERFQSFERTMEEETRRRREAEDSKLGVMRDTMGKLEKTLNSEIKRRVEANKALQSMFESQIATVQDKLEAVFVEKLNHLQLAADELSDRMALLSRGKRKLDNWISEHEYKTEGRFEQERKAREQKYQALREELAQAKQVRVKGDEKFQTFIPMKRDQLV
eukprot:g6171.t1